jgi:hypothetical protein
MSEILPYRDDFDSLHPLHRWPLSKDWQLSDAQKAELAPLLERWYALAERLQRQGRSVEEETSDDKAYQSLWRELSLFAAKHSSPSKARTHPPHLTATCDYDPERGRRLTFDEMTQLMPYERGRLLPVSRNDPADPAAPLNEAIRRERIILDVLRIGKIAIRPGILRERVQTLWRWFRQVLPAQHLHARPRIRNEREFENALALLEKALASWATATTHSGRASDAERPEPGSPAAEPPRLSLDEEGMLILCALASNRGRLLTYTEISSACQVSRGTITKRMPHLLADGLVVRPNGANGGTDITVRGEEWLRRIELPARAQKVLKGTLIGEDVLRDIERARNRRRGES